MKKILLIVVLTTSYFNCFSQISLVKDFGGTNSGNPASTNPDNTIVFNNKLLFTVNNTANGGIDRLFETDGTTAGTLNLKYGSGTTERFQSDSPSWQIVTDNFGNETLAFNGTREGLPILFNLFTSNDLTTFNFNAPQLLPTGELQSLNNNIYAIGIDGSSLIRYDLLNSSINTVKTFGQQIVQMFPFNDKIYLRADEGDDAGRELYVYNPTSGNTNIVEDINTVLIGDPINPLQTLGSDPSDFIEVNGKLYFIANNDGLSKKIHVYDGTTITTIPNTINPKDLTVLTIGSTTFLIHTATHSGFRRLAVLNTTNEVAEALTFAIDEPEELIAYNGYVYFSGKTTSGKELFRTQEIMTSIELVANINPTTIGSVPTDFMEYNDELYFRAKDGTHGQELWKVDINNNVSMIDDFVTGSDDFAPIPLAVYNNELYLNGVKEGTTERELFKYRAPTLTTTDFGNNKVEVFPNPTSEYFKIESNDLSNIESVSVFSITGQLVKEFKNQRDTYNIRDLDIGLYTIKISTLKGLVIKKLIVK